MTISRLAALLVSLLAVSAAAQSVDDASQAAAAAAAKASKTAFEQALKRCDAKSAELQIPSVEYGLPVRRMMVTDDAAFYYHMDCDICGDIDRCELKSGKMTNVVHAHQVSCADLAPFKKGRKIVQACSDR